MLLAGSAVSELTVSEFFHGFISVEGAGLELGDYFTLNYC